MSAIKQELKESPYIHDPDVRLMLRVKNEDEEAFSELMSSYQDRLVGIFTNLLDGKQSAEDLAQEVFLRVYRARHSYEPTAKFSTWLFRIANNVASNIRRKNKNRKEVKLNPKETGSMGIRPEEQIIADKSALMPNRQIANRELQLIVRNALDELGENQQMAVLLNKFEGMNYSEIAECMDLTPSAVKSLLSRAREKLRTILEQYINLV